MHVSTCCRQTGCTGLGVEVLTGLWWNGIHEAFQCYFVLCCQMQPSCESAWAHRVLPGGQGGKVLGCCMNPRVQDKPLWLLSALYGRMWFLGHIWIRRQGGLLEALHGHGPRLAQGLADRASRPALSPCCGVPTQCCTCCTRSLRP